MVKTTTLKEVAPETLDEVHQLFNASLESEIIEEHLFERCTAGNPNFEPEDVLLAFEDDRLVGALLMVERRREPRELIERDRAKAWILMMGAAPEHPRRAELLARLLEECERIAREHGKEILRVSDFASWYFWAGVPTGESLLLYVLENAGFRKVDEVVDYEVDMLRFHVPERVRRLERLLEEQGVRFRRPEPKEEREIAEWVARHFGIAWGYETRLAFRHRRPTVWVAEHEGEIIGFVDYAALAPNWFGPIGVLPSARLRGIGTVLMFKALESLRRMGRRYVIIPWTKHLHFYAQVPGVCRIRNLKIMEKRLT